MENDVETSLFSTILFLYIFYNLLSMGWEGLGCVWCFLRVSYFFRFCCTFDIFAIFPCVLSFYTEMLFSMVARSATIMR